MSYTPPTAALDAALDVAYASPDVMSAALTAAAPAIQAAALREAAEYAVANIAIWDGNATLTDVSTEASYEDTASWLRARADQLEGK